MKIDVLYVTCLRDVAWFRESLRVLLHNLSGYESIGVVVAEDELDAVRERVSDVVDDRVLFQGVPGWPGQGYYWQQWVKCHADVFMPHADVVCHVDSDVFIARPCHVGEFFHGDRPAWMWQWRTDDMTVPWGPATTRALGWRNDREFMMAFPFMIRRDTYPLLRRRVEERQRVSLERYLKKVGHGGVAFSEFNALGEVAWRQQRDAYSWVYRNGEEWPTGVHKSRQFWGHAPAQDHAQEIEQMITGGSGQFPVVTNRGYWVLSNDTHISKWVTEHGRLDFDSHFMGLCCQHIRPGDVVVDVGAFIGDHTLAYAKATHGVDSGRVIAFEPNPAAFTCLQRNLSGYGHVECRNEALGSAPGEMTLALDPNAGGSHLTPGSGVKVVMLDSLGLEWLDFMKVDAEGFELFVLMGAEQTISRCKPKMVLEVNPGAMTRQGATPGKLIDWLELRGYQVERIQGDDSQHDILCTPRS